MNIQMNEFHGIGICDTCRIKNKHVCALEGDKYIFDNVFKPSTNERPNDGSNEQHGDLNPMFLDDN
jgi:hypothetical protein